MDQCWAIWSYNYCWNSVFSAWLAPPGDGWQLVPTELWPQQGPSGIQTRLISSPQDKARALSQRGRSLRGMQQALLSAPPGLKAQCPLQVLLNSGFQRASLRKVKHEDSVHRKGRKKNVKPPHPTQRTFYSAQQINLYFPVICIIISDLLAAKSDCAFCCCSHRWFYLPSPPSANYLMIWKLHSNLQGESLIKQPLQWIIQEQYKNHSLTHLFQPT